MISFEPNEDQQLIISTVAEFAKTTLAPRERDFEKAKTVPADVRLLLVTAARTGFAAAAPGDRALLAQVAAREHEQTG